jgi:hypothetical protein
MAEDLDEWFEARGRKRRWIALHEDEPTFGLVPSEKAELAALDKEFGAWPTPRSDHRG